MQAVQDKHELQVAYAVAGEEIPIIDLGPYLNGESGASEEAAREMCHALEQIGFFFIINHGVPAFLRGRVIAATADFYALPLEQKMALKINHAGVGYIPNRGEFGKHSRYYTGQKKPDVSEAFLLQRDWAPCPTQNRNQWPEEAEFQHAMREYFEAATALSQRMLPLYARALDVAPDFFADKFPADRALNVLRISHMPPDPLEDNEFNICPHSDGSFATLLATSDQPGLEILSQTGRWLTAPLIPDAFVVNSGDLLTRWSNGRFLSTPHRVRNASGTHRYSSSFFFQPTPETLIDCLPTCCGPDNPPKNPPITCGAYMKKFLEASFAMGDNVYNDQGELVSASKTLAP
mgnify:FL=1